VGQVEQERVRYNSDGEKLYYSENGLWVPEGYEIVPDVYAQEPKEVVRPQIPLLGTVLSVLVPLATLFLLALVFNRNFVDVGSTSLFFVFLGVYVFLSMRAILLFAIILYQKFAPAEVRNKCVFTPTCSNYSMMALKKYGVLVGCIKTIGRLRRCHLPNGGEDYP